MAEMGIVLSENLQIFTDFFRGRWRNFFFISVAVGGQIFPNKLHI
jgi:hypothetical protein